MPLANNNYVSPAWIDNAAPPINDDELNAMSQTLEGSQILAGSGAPTSATPGEVGQRYADISTTPAKIYELKQTNPNVWKEVLDQNANTARPYSTGGNYAAGDYCIHEGKLWKALEATSGAWDGSKWERARYADGLSGHVADQENPHHVTAAQTGALTGTVIATEQTTNIAVRNYTAGEYFLFDGKLYVLKEDVPQGGDLFAENPEWDSGVTMLEFNKWYPMVNSVTQEPRVGYYIRIRTDTEEPGVARYWFVGGLQPNALHPVVAQHTEESLSYVYETCEGREPPQATYQAGFLITKYSGLTPDGWSYGFVSLTYWIEMLLYNATPFVGTREEMESLISNTRFLTSEETTLGDDVAALPPKTGSITLSASWTGSDPYSQTVAVTGAAVTAKSKIDLVPTAAQLDALAEDGVISLLIENNNGTLTAWAVGAQPIASMTISCTVTETV